MDILQSSLAVSSSAVLSLLWENFLCLPRVILDFNYLDEKK